MKDRSNNTQTVMTNDRLEGLLHAISNSSEPLDRISALNGLEDYVRSNNLIVDQHLEIAENLVSFIPFESDVQARTSMFTLVESILHKDLSVMLNIDPLIQLFDKKDDAFVALTLLLFPLATSTFNKREIANSLLRHSHDMIRRNADYALKYMMR